MRQALEPPPELGERGSRVKLTAASSSVQKEIFEGSPTPRAYFNTPYNRMTLRAGHRCPTRGISAMNRSAEPDGAAQGRLRRNDTLLFVMARRAIPASLKSTLEMPESIRAMTVKIRSGIWRRYGGLWNLPLHAGSVVTCRAVLHTRPASGPRKTPTKFHMSRQALKLVGPG